MGAAIGEVRERWFDRPRNLFAYVLLKAILVVLLLLLFSGAGQNVVYVGF